MEDKQDETGVHDVALLHEKQKCTTWVVEEEHCLDTVRLVAYHVWWVDMEIVVVRDDTCDPFEHLEEANERHRDDWASFDTHDAASFHHSSK